MAHTVTCCNCGCLNFSSTHSACDKCRPTHNMMTSSHNVLHLTGASSGSAPSRDVHVRSLGNKRRYSEIRLAAATAPVPKRQQHVKSVFYKKQQQQQPTDVIDLISDSDDVASDGHSDSAKHSETTAGNDSAAVASADLFQSRVFPSVVFVASHFPSVEDGAMLRKLATETGRADAQQREESVVVTTLPTSCQAPALRATSTARALPSAQAVDWQPQPTVKPTPPAVAGVEPTRPPIAAGETKAVPIVKSTPPPVAAGETKAVPIVKSKRLPIAVVDPEPHLMPIVAVKTKPLSSAVVEPRKPPVAGVDSRPVPVVAQKSQQKEQQSATTVETVMKKSDDLDAAKKSEKKLVTDVGSARAQVKEGVRAEGKLKDALSQSRVFEQIEFRATDFVTAAQVWATARRSHLPPLKSTVLIAASGRPSTATEDGCRHANDLTGLVETTKVTSPTDASITSSTPTVIASPAEPVEALRSARAPSQVLTSTHFDTTSDKSSSASSSAGRPHPVAKSSVSLATAAALPPAAPEPVPSAVKELTKVLAVRPVDSPSVQNQKIPTPSTVVQSIAPALKPPTSFAEGSAKPAASASSTLESTLTAELQAEVTVSATPWSTVDTATKSPSASATYSVRTQATDNVNVLVPKEMRHEVNWRSTDEQRHQQPSLAGANASTEVDGKRHHTASAAPPKVARVAPPVLGYCSPEFLEFMRECGNAEYDEEDDPDEASRLQLKLLDVVDLTNLSSSENGDTTSPLSTPRVGELGVGAQQLCPSTSEVVEKGGQRLAGDVVNTLGQRTWYVPTLESERKRTQPEKVMCELCEEKGLASRLVRCPTCTKYYHKKCAEENGDESICWNCELGSMIDDSELDEEHAKHNSEYLAYLKAIRRSPDDADAEDERMADNEDDEQEDDEVIAEVKTEMESVAGGGEDSNVVNEMHVQSAGRRWKEFIGDATADVDDSYLEITKRITEELCDNEKKTLYSRGFVSREEFEAQMHEVEEHYIKEEARLQQLEREKALEAKKVAEAKLEQAEAEQAITSSQCVGNNAAANDNPMASELVVQSKSASTGDALPSADTTSAVQMGTASNLPTGTQLESTLLYPSQHKRQFLRDLYERSTPVHPAVSAAAEASAPTPFVPAATCAAASEVVDNGPPPVTGQPSSKPL
ncbi:unnamed protein product [Hyaloperonospora brassicae]|uniref:Zinc finger PHD-type domain-containing protein n=1 Tax=Hyaloperonospora brassicae TaxID=162125 RepID=A0AAV0U072_HYABA|nr:unnamed protein product [Hyaloperonospora brassicae]